MYRTLKYLSGGRSHGGNRFYGADLPGANRQLVDGAQPLVRQVVGFSIPNQSDGDFIALQRGQSNAHKKQCNSHGFKIHVLTPGITFNAGINEGPLQ